jgi:aldehyde dehydrogenase (NAD+)
MTSTDTGTVPDHLDALFVGGAWVAPAGSDTLTVVNPTTEEPLATVPACTPADVDRAVTAARAAFPAWAATPVAERAELLDALADGLAARVP